MYGRLSGAVLSLKCYGNFNLGRLLLKREHLAMHFRVAKLTGLAALPLAGGGDYLPGRPRFANLIPLASSAALRSIPAFFNASLFSGPFGIDRAFSKA